MKFISQLLPLQANTGELAPEKMTEKVELVKENLWQTT